MAIILYDNVLSPEPHSLVENKGIFSATAVAKESLAERLDTLEGKTVYLVDIGYGGSYKFMQALERWFKRNMPSVNVVRRRKPVVLYGWFPRIVGGNKAKGHAAVIGVAGWIGWFQRSLNAVLHRTKIWNTDGAFTTEAFISWCMKRP